MATILIVDDEVGIRELLSEILRDEGYDVVLAENAQAARVARNRARPDLVLLDIWMPDTDGVTLLREWSAGGQLTMPVVMMSGHGSIDTAVEATRIGAADFLEKPIAMQKLLAAVKRAQTRVPVSHVQELRLSAFTRSAPLRDLRRRLDQVASKSRSLLLKSPPGGIAELVARSLTPEGKSFVDLSSSTAPIDLSALEGANGGVLYVPDLAKLGRLQQKNVSFAIERLERYNLRLVAVAFPSAPAGERHEEHLSERLFEVLLALPSLSELKDDIPDIAAQLLSHLVEAGDAPLRLLSTAAQNALRNHPWPGGYAELRGVVRSLALAATEEEVSGDDVAKLLGDMPDLAATTLPLDLPLREAREAFEKLYFEYHLKRDGSNMTRLAERTGLERTHLYRKLKGLGLPAGRRGEE